MAKIAFLNLGLLGHINPSLAVAEELVRRGHEVVYLLTPEYAELVRQTGARFRAYDSILHKTVGPQAKAMPLRLLDEVRHVLPQLRTALQEEKPDVLLYDMMAFAGHWAAREAKIPGVRFHPSYAQNPLFRIQWPFAQDAKVLDAYEEAAADLERDLGVPKVPMNDLMMLAGDLNLVFLPRAFQPRSETFDERFVFTGPVLVEHEDLSTFDWNFPQQGPLLYFSLGTIFNARPDLFRACADAFAGTRWRVAMALGSRVAPEALGKLPPNVFAAPFLPQLAILAKTDLFISHGGMNSVQGALYHGVPLVVCPQMREQQESARRVAELGLGVNLEEAELSAAVLREAAERVATDTAMRERARTFGEVVRRERAATVAAKAVEEFLGK